MSNRKHDMYRWDRFTKPRVYSRTQRVATNDDIQDWIKKVEEASNNAAAATFGAENAKVKAKPKTRSAAAATVEELHLHDAAYAEAQDLLQHWVDNKLDFDTNPEYTEKGWEEQWQRKTQADIKREWDHLLHPDDDTVDATASLDLELESLSSARSDGRKEDPYKILEQDSDGLVTSILQGMLEKEVVEDNVVRDLGLDGTSKKQSDPRLKMQLRHQQVKENREKRIQDKQRQLREQQMKKDAHFKARQLIKQEEQNKLSQAKREEREIQKEMARLRKEMTEERQKKEDEKRRMEEERDALARQAQQQFEAEEERQRQEHWRSQRAVEEKERMIKHKMVEIEAREAKDNLKLLQRCFSAWYNLVIERRLQLGKAKAMGDWKLLLRSWNAWRSYVRSRVLDQETLRHQAHLKESRRREAMAQSHYRLRQLKKCLLAWQLFTTQQQNKRDLEQTQNKTRNKMAAFLQAAASGRLPGQGQGHGQGHDLDSTRSRSQQDIGDSINTEERVDELFSQEGRVQVCPGSSRSDATSSTARSDRSYGSSTGRSGRNKPTDGWQVTRKHAKVTKEELAAFGQSQGQGDRIEGKGSPADLDPDGMSEFSAPRKGKKAWEKTPFAVSNFEHRHTAQQKLLEAQQKQLKEQQRLIEEMQYLQRQQLLQQQLMQPSPRQLDQQQPIGDGDDGATGRTPKLQAHLENLQKTLVQDGADSEISTDRSETTTVSALTSARSMTSVASTAKSVGPSSTVSTASNNSRHTKFLKTMGGRAEERARIKKEREEKKRKIEEERLARLEAEADARKREEEEEKQKKIEAYREKKRLEKEREKEKQQQAERLKGLLFQAEEHSRVAVIRFRGWRPWRKLVEMSQSNTEKADAHYKDTLQRKVLLTWHRTVETELQEKRQLADEMHKFLLFRRCFSNWKRVGEYMTIQEEKAQRFHEQRLLSRILQAWADFAAEEKIARWRHERIAREHNLVRIQKRALRAWTRFPQFLREEKQREKRLEEMRRKVASLIPDYEETSAGKDSADYS